MNDKKGSRHHEPVSSPSGDDDVRRLLETAGPRTAIPSDDLETIKEAARTEYRQHWSRRSPRSGLVVGLGLVASVLLVFSALWLSRQTDIGVPSTPEAARVAVVELVNGPLTVLETDSAPRALNNDDFVHSGDTLETGNGTAALRLASGLSLRLDRETRVRFAGESIVELLQGALYAASDLGGSVDSLLRVHTPFGEVRDIGTQFEVRRSSSPERLRIRVREGKVVLEQESAVYSARAGEELSLGSDGEVDRGKVSTYGPQWGWILSAAPPFDVQGRPLHEYLDWLARETGWQIRLAADALGIEDQPVRGGYADGVRPDESYGVVLLALRLKGTLSDGVLHIEPVEAKPTGS